MVRRFVTGAALVIAGCGSPDGAMPVTGTVEWPGGELTGHTIEVSLATDPTVRGFGTIEPDGRFSLERLVDGKTVAVLLPGDYRARLIINDEGDGQTKKPKVPARYLDFKTAGWPVQVPPGAVPLTIAAK